MIYKRTLLLMVFFMILTYLSFILVDFSLRSTRLFTYTDVSYFKIIRYYLYHFIQFLNLFLPLTYLLSFIITLSSMNQNSELTALLTNGIAKKSILRIYLIIGIFTTSLLYLNHQYFIPKSSQYIANFKDDHLRKPGNIKKEYLFVKTLKNEGKLIYQAEISKGKLFDVFYLCSENSLYRIKYLDLNTTPVQGEYVDEFIKDQNGAIKKTKSYEQLQFPQIAFSKKMDKKEKIPLENLSLSRLYRSYQKKYFSSSKEKYDLLAQINFKLATPLFPIILLLMIAPFCFSFSRNKSIFLITAIGLFTFISMYILMDCALVLAENKVLHPSIILWVPIGITFLIGMIFTKKLVFN
ncbi:MAG TPA: LptF/LptG family permease [Chlamydiales bacterium]|nr:LptF/LptG family permease [Chlamydiales bacterium]